MALSDHTVDLLEQLQTLTLKLGICVRFENLNAETENATSRGGLCRVMDRQYVIIDSGLNEQQKCAVLLEALGQLDLTKVYVPPALRGLIDGGKCPI